jgi:hypothetical protein
VADHDSAVLANGFTKMSATETPDQKFDHLTLIFGGTPKNSVFLEDFLDQNRYPDEIRELNGEM